MASFITAQQREALIELYIGYFNRAPEAAGLNYWAGELLAALDAGQTEQQALAGIANRFYDAGVQYGVYSNAMTVEQFITTVYQNVLGRNEVDSDGMTYWTQKLTSGEVSRGQFVREIIQEAKDYVAAVPDSDPYKWVGTYLDNRKAVGEWFANNSTGLTGQAAIDQGTAIIANSVTAATAQAGQTTAQAVAAAQASQAAQQGQIFMLTAGADTVAGTSGNDTINALTINAAGTAATTFSAFDVIDGGAGTDTLNVYSDDTGNVNDTFPSTITVKNVEIVNILNANAAAAGVFGDASKYEGVQQLWQVGFADNVTKLAATTTAGFKTVDANVSVAPTDAAASVAIALDNYGEGRTITVDGSAAAATLNAVTVSGTVKDTNADATVAATTLAVTTGKDVESVTVTTAVKTTLTVTENAASGATKDVRTVDASASTGAVTFAGSVTGGTAGSVATIKGGSGDDTLTIVTATLKDDASTAADETVSALVDGGAGKDNITINTTGTGTTTVNAGDGNDTVTLTADGSGKLTVNLGAGDDIFKGAGAVAGTDSIDAGAGTDTLLLSMVGVANIGAFANFENFDVAGLNSTLDVDILATKNTVTEIVGSAALGGNSTLTNLGAGVGFRATGDMGTAATLSLTQKTAGALTVTVDADEATADTLANTHDAKVTATNATSLKAVFSSDYADKLTAVANSTELTLTGSKATSLTVESNGTETTNTLNYISAANGATGDDLLTSATLSGASKLTFNVTYSGANQESLISVDASAMTGALVFDLVDLKASTDTTFAGGVLKLGSGDDVITGATMTTVSGIEKGTAENSTLQSNYDVIKIASAVQATDVAATATITVKDGLLTFNGTGPATLDAAIALAATATDAANEAVVFEYVGNSYIYATGATAGAGADDVVIKLAGITGLAGLDDVNAAGTNLYVF